MVCQVDPVGTRGRCYTAVSNTIYSKRYSQLSVLATRIGYIELKKKRGGKIDNSFEAQILSERSVVHSAMIKLFLLLLSLTPVPIGKILPGAPARKLLLHTIMFRTFKNSI